MILASSVKCVAQTLSVSSKAGYRKLGRIYAELVQKQLGIVESSFLGVVVYFYASCFETRRL